MRSQGQNNLEKRLRSLLRRVNQERSLGAISAGKARRCLAADYAQAQRANMQLPAPLKEATEAALRSPVRIFPGRTTWNSTLAIYQPVALVDAPASLLLPLDPFRQRAFFRAS